MWMIPIFSGAMFRALGRIVRRILAAEGGVTPLDETYDDRARGRDERPRPGVIVEILLGRGVVELAD